MQVITTVLGFSVHELLSKREFESWGSASFSSRDILSSHIAKLSLEEIVDNVENLLYLDEDVVFLDDPCKAHQVFDDMPETALFGMAANMSPHYREVRAKFAAKIPTALQWRGEAGVNSGVRPIKCLTYVACKHHCLGEEGRGLQLRS